MSERDAGKITKVRVFIDRAAITRTRKVELSSDLEKISFAPIPLDVQTATLRATARLESDGSAVPVTGVTSTLLFDEIQQERPLQIKKALAEIDVELNRIEDAESTETHAGNLLKSYAEIATRKLSVEWLDQNPPFDKWSETFDHLRRTRAKLASSRVSRQEARTRHQLRRAELLTEERAGGRPTKIGLDVKVGLDLPEGKKGCVIVELTYITERAQWMPAYNARHTVQKDKEESIALTAIALVRQSTGEDWEDIELIATTARPPLSEPPPELTKLVVSGYQGGEDKSIVSTARQGPRLQGSPDAGARLQEATVEHKAKGLVSVPSTQRTVRVELFEESVDCVSRLEVAPMDRPVPLLIAEVSNRTGRVLLPGRVSIFQGPNYSGQAELGFVSAGERFQLPLGTDASLRIKRDVTSLPEKKTALSGTMNYAFECCTVIENISAAPVEVLVRDRVPVSRSEETSVKITQIDRAMEVDSETGGTTLQLTIAPHTKREVNTAFKISAPRGFKVVLPSAL